MQVYNVFELLGGLGLFLFGMKLMGDGLELVAGSKLKALISKLTKNKYVGALVGALVTAIIQSSSATTVMVVGFVNAGMMTLSQAVGVIFGANVGTTITGIMIAINLTKISPIAIFAGVSMMFFLKRQLHQNVGQIITGFGVIFLGMDMMSNSMRPITDSLFLREIITSLNNPVIGLLVGITFTAIIQSSSASLGVLQALGLAGAIPLSSAVFVIYGQNIGTCITAIIASVGTTKTAKRTAVLHLLFNALGAVLFTLLTIFFPFVKFIEKIALSNVMVQVSIIHLIFNISCAAIFLPLSEFMIKFACKLVPGQDEVKEGLSLKYIDSRILSSPPIAVSQTLREVERMGKLAKKNFDLAMKSFLHANDKKLSEVYENEKIINFLNTRITEYIVKINGLDISILDRKILGSLFHVVSDFERIGDHCKNICELYKDLKTENGVMPFKASEEIREIYFRVSSVFDKSILVLKTRSKDPSLIKELIKNEDKIDFKTEMFKNNNIVRLNEGKCDAISGTVYMDLLNNLERIADHCTNVAHSVFEKSQIKSFRKKY